jgi:hypothetical protein
MGHTFIMEGYGSLMGSWYTANRVVKIQHLKTFAWLPMSVPETQAERKKAWFPESDV